MHRFRCSGHTLTELLVVLAILGATCLVMLPMTVSMAERTAIRSATARIRGLLVTTREEAIALQAHRGLRFMADGAGWQYAIYQDGDADGVRTADIASGVDTLVDGPWTIVSPRALATLMIPPGGLPHPDSGDVMPEGSRPVRFGNSSLCVFSSDGSSTPGTIYIAARSGNAAAVRCAGDGGRIRILHRTAGADDWIEE